VLTASDAENRVAKDVPQVIGRDATSFAVFVRRQPPQE
jgi:hypothetical protein